MITRNNNTKPIEWTIQTKLFKTKKKK